MAKLCNPATLRFHAVSRRAADAQSTPDGIKLRWLAKWPPLPLRPALHVQTTGHDLWDQTPRFPRKARDARWSSRPFDGDGNNESNEGNESVVDSAGVFRRGRRPQRITAPAPNGGIHWIHFIHRYPQRSEGPSLAKSSAGASPCVYPPQGGGMARSARGESADRRSTETFAAGEGHGIPTDTCGNISPTLPCISVVFPYRAPARFRVPPRRGLHKEAGRSVRELRSSSPPFLRGAFSVNQSLLSSLEIAKSR